MPAKSEVQKRFFLAEYGRKKRGEPTKTDMSKKKLREFIISSKGKNLPERVK